MALQIGDHGFLDLAKVEVVSCFHNYASCLDLIIVGDYFLRASLCYTNFYDAIDTSLYLQRKQNSRSCIDSRVPEESASNGCMLLYH
jgi:hypothetical protein